ncbi:MAG: FAD-dependent oxidoreductase [Dehalococcoidales bacterium]|nr:FAD-dependent oxidoreductase [Dehalococcoidales bacterium]
MALMPFKHLNATSLTEAVSILDKYKEKARLVAGGTDLLGVLEDNIHSTYPEVLVNVKTVAGLDYIREDAEGLKIGALTKLRDIEMNQSVKGRYRILAEAAHAVASPQIRNMGTIAGNICQETRCWYYRNPENMFQCLRKGGKVCNAFTGENRYHSIYGAAGVVKPPCSSNCPAGVDIPAYANEIREGDLAEAAKILLESNPIPAITGRVCPHFCEQECNRGDYDEAVSVRCMERFMGDYILEKSAGIIELAGVDTGKRVAVVGSGPAGLSAAYYLRKHGHRVTVFERMAEAGGMLMYGIPPYRLPKDVVRRQVKVLQDMGIEFRVKQKIGVDVSVDGLMESFDAVFLGCGAWKERDLGINGEKLAKSGLEFLNRASLESGKVRGWKVAVVGGGNVAIDVARTLLRLGAEPVVIYRRSEAEMPAIREEVEKAKEEGIKFDFLTLPVEARENKGKTTLKCVRMKLGSMDASGRPRPIPIGGSEFTADFDAVMKAIGEAPDTSHIPAGFLDDQGQLRVDSATGLLGKNLFAGGDFVSGPSTVVGAIAAGKQAAGSIDLFLEGKAAEDERKAEEAVQSLRRFDSACLGKTGRVEMPELSVSERVKSIDIEDTLSLGLAKIEGEAKRCFNCGCIAVSPSDIAPALIALDGKIKTTKRTIEAEKFFVAGLMKSTVLDPDELVVEIQIPAQKAGSKQIFLKSRIRKSIDFPIMDVASVFNMESGKVNEARIVLGAVAPIPMRMREAEDFLKGRKVSEEVAEAAAVMVVKGANPVAKNKYKVQMAKALVKRAILAMC